MPRKIAPEDKIDRVVESARKLFVEKGFHSVSIPDVVKMSGVSTGAIYHHFGNKENLAKQIHEKTLSDFTAALSEKVAGLTSTREKLRAYAGLVFDIAGQSPVTMEYMLFMRHGEFLKDTPPVCLAQPFRWVQDTIKSGMDSGEVKAGNPLIAAASFTGVIIRMIQLHLEGVATESFADTFEETFENAWASFTK